MIPVAAAILVAISSCTGAGSSTNPDQPARTSQPADERCTAPPSPSSPLPGWAVSLGAPSAPPHQESSSNRFLAVLWAPLRAGRKDNKILWISRHPRQAGILRIDGVLTTDTSNHVEVEAPAASGPGHEYPSYVDVPRPGCWRFQLELDNLRDVIHLRYQP